MDEMKRGAIAYSTLYAVVSILAAILCVGGGFVIHPMFFTGAVMWLGNAFAWTTNIERWKSIPSVRRS
jgi:uncharacterized membrane protein